MRSTEDHFDTEFCHFRGFQIAATELAILFREDCMDEDEAVWLPKSQIEISSMTHHPENAYAHPEIEVDVPEWLALEKGLI